MMITKGIPRFHGFGSAFPIYECSDFLKNTEQLIKEFKIIIFIWELRTQQLQYVQVTK
jgi:hypothetical protein